MPSISVIIPACNEEKYIEHTIQSLQQQEYPDYEAIIVCNGCTDGTEKISKKLENDKIKVISFKEANVSKAKNIGATKANGEILLFLDADSLVSNDTLKEIAKNFTSEHAVATTKAKPDILKLKYNLAMNFKNFYINSGLYQGCSGALICRKEDFDKVDGYDSSIIVKEHRKLILKLKQLNQGKFTCINTHITTSMRRFEQWGLAKATVFWINQWIKNYVGDLKKSDYEKVR